MSVIFLKILNISLVAGWLILAVLLLRLILKKAPKWISCLLWALVALRLLLPFSIESALSLIPSGEIISTDIVTSDATPKINTGIYFVNNTVNPVVEETFTPVSEVKKSPLQIGISVASIVWVAGMIGMFLYYRKDTIIYWLSKRYIIVLAVYTICVFVFYYFIPRVGFYAPIGIGITLPVMIIAVAYGLGKHRLKYEVSYGMYLYHFIVINALIQMDITEGIIAIAIVVPISVLMGFAQNILIDKPLAKIRLK